MYRTTTRRSLPEVISEILNMKTHALAAVIEEFSGVLQVAGELERKRIAGKLITREQLRQVNEYLKKYSVPPLVVHEKIGAKFDLSLAFPIPRRRMMNPEELAREFALWLQRLVLEGEILRVQRCDRCERWFSVKRFRERNLEGTFCQECRRPGWQKLYYQSKLSVNKDLYREGYTSEELRKMTPEQLERLRKKTRRK